jgi:hypothetical protein
MCASTESQWATALSLAAKGSVVEEKRRTRCPFKMPFPHPGNGLYKHIWIMTKMSTLLDSEGFWWWCITLRINGIWTLSNLWYSKEYVLETEPVSVLGWGDGKTPTLLGLLERYTLNHWWCIALRITGFWTSCIIWYVKACSILETGSVTILRWGGGRHLLCWVH